MLCVLLLAVVSTILVARRRGLGRALARQLAAWLPALPLAVPLPSWLGSGFPELYRPLALVVIAAFQVAMMLPERKPARGREWGPWHTAWWLLEVVVAPVLLAVLAGLHFATWRYHGLGTPDEALLCYAAKRVAEGAVLYRDVQYPSGPGLPWLLAVLFRVSGPSLPAAKWLLGISAVAGVWATYLLGRRVAPAPLAFLVALAIIPRPLPVGLTLALLAVASAFHPDWRREVSWGVAGLLTGGALVFDPVMGAIVAFALVVMAGVRRVGLVQERVGGRGVDLAIGWRTIARYLGAAALVLLPVVLVVRWGGGWPWLLADLRAHPWGSLAPGMLATIPVLPLVPAGGGWSAVLEASARLDSISAMLLGLMAWFILGIRLLARQWTERDFLALSLVLVAGALTLRPLAGGYLAPVYLLAAFAAGWGAELIWRALVCRGRVQALVGPACGLGVVLAAAWPMVHMLVGQETAWSRPVPQPMSALGMGSLSGALRAPAAEAATLRALSRRLAQVTDSSRPILVLPGNPALNFLSQRASGTRLAAVSAWELDTPTTTALLRLVQQGKVAALVLDVEAVRRYRERLAPVWEVTKALTPAGEFGRYRLWLVRAAPQPPAGSR